MQQAIGNRGNVIPAAEHAPQTAACPHCGDTVFLRQRRSMDGTVSYYWRHKRNRALDCRGRTRPLMRRR